MPKAIPANVTPRLLEWARDQSGLSLEAVARRVGVTPERLASWVEKTLSRAGRPLTQLVVEALDTNRITAVDASRFLELRFDHFELSGPNSGLERVNLRSN